MESQSDRKSAEGYGSLQRDKECCLALAGRHPSQVLIEEALKCFDLTVSSGIVDARIYGYRGACLQMLDFHLDAIDDLDKAIAAAPDDSNLFFIRSVSKGAVGDLRGRVADLEEAIRVASTLQVTNSPYAALVQGRGYPEGSVGFYRAQLKLANIDLEIQEHQERFVRESKHPGPADLVGPDLSTYRRAKARRRDGGPP